MHTLLRTSPAEHNGSYFCLDMHRVVCKEHGKKAGCVHNPSWVIDQCKSLIPAQECGEHAVKHVCNNSEAGWSSARRCTGFQRPDPGQERVCLCQSREVGMGGWRGWQEGILGARSECFVGERCARRWIGPPPSFSSTEGRWDWLG